MPFTIHTLARRYNRIVLLTVTIVVIVVIGTNTVIDPKAKLDLLSINKLNAIKYLATGGRHEKSIRLRNSQFDTLIIGSSRTQVGIDPSHPSLKGNKAYNAALSGTNMEELSGVLKYAGQHQDISQLIFGLDFLLFTSNKKTSPDYFDSLFAGSTSWIMPYLLSTSTFKRSLKTIKLNRKGSDHIYSNDEGFIDKTGVLIDHRKRFEEVLKLDFLVDPEYYGAYSYSYESLAHLENSLSDYLKKGSAIKLFISPVHARQLEAIHAIGLWETYLQWRQDLVLLIHKLETRYSADIPLWDFSGYNSITTEPVPASGSNIEMKWYWESSHYKKSVGNLILNRISGYNTADVPPDFGLRINTGNLADIIDRNRRNRQFYSTKYPDEVSDVINITRETRKTRDIRASMFKK